ncbi:ABC transporter ATP-binding protein [Shewanella sp. JNE10-2]|uniref:ABC transporter ATP-binding protein n=1 Tax=unclassified Shewanella TaxID=196818 RepID=UPI002002A3F4|nr:MULTISPECIES: ABC transporter ATP-binding protein [unclassified Shewanella]MCK7631371.1 ABC transporter ATP-binding protein [Shewanella sp. JNE9-1]MCK7646691.1 ABC transporter ATP-binding protein [Shewanella sp. JNE3-1]MCK7654631.1 ABC transporter ATP-binding protein [Shewanella sp. JNE4-1]UPO25652.1 ABC transporter ATP-binding protein [Shewanella sp. JNE10-2]UPO36637.1 ABC transporter ATP-binding protein [Shewanella sp. JNE7]
MSQTDFAIQTQGMTRAFGGINAVENLDLAIPKGTIYGFLGPNGCGKSTSIRMLTGLLSPTSGNIRVLGETLPGAEEKLRRRIGYMTQKFSLYDNLSVRENLEFVAQIYGLTRRQSQQLLAELLTLYDLVGREKQMAGSMSGGQRQRLALAAATLHHPELLFLDEPTSAVDPENRREFWERLFDLCAQGTTILVSTHYMDEAERCHGLAILERGIKRADGSPQQLMAAMGARVLEVSGDDLRTLKQSLMSESAVLSAAQIGSRLRVLVRSDIADPLAWLKPKIANRAMEEVRASLEDVFVTCTGERLAAHAKEASHVA